MPDEKALSSEARTTAGGAAGTPYAFSAQAVMRAFGTSERGLSPDEARRRLAKFGHNELKEERKKSILEMFLAQFASFMIVLLLAAALIAAALGEWIDAAAIAAILVLNAVLGTVQEHRAEKALEALKKMAAPSALVVRSGVEESIPTTDVVPGDIIVIEAGSLVPADCRLVETAMLKVNEAALTGESAPVHKEADAALPAQTLVTGRSNMLFSGTVLSNGRGTGVVTATGMKTEFGKIASAVQTVVDEETPLKKMLEKIGKQLTIIIIAAALVLFVIGSLQSIPALEMFLTSISLAVAAIPEGLPATITIALAIGVQRMSRRNAIVRKLASVETLGSASVICTDKTGTITKNEMTARKLFVSGEWFDVAGSGYETKGEFRSSGRAVEPGREPALQDLLRVAALCNNASLVLDAKKGVTTAVGDPTEAALLALAEKAGVERSTLKHSAKFIQEFPFDSDRKRMTVVYDFGGETLALMKGAPEVVLDKCASIAEGRKRRALTKAGRAAILGANRAMASKALRVLAFAQRRMKDGRKRELSEVEKDFTFIGLVGLIDAPREEVRPALELCRQAGIDVVMITGDNELTARAVAEEIGLFKNGDEVVSGAELDAMPGSELASKVERIRVYARVSPEHKLRIVDAWKSRGHIVAMTGDGVNDAPALKRADIGVSMGVTGTDVAKEVSDVVLADDNFASIVNAVEEGRGIYSNIRKCIAFLLSGNVAEVGIVFLTVLLGFPLPLVAVQLLWINLITDGLPAIALSVDPISRDVMKAPPRDRKKSVWAGMRAFLLDAPVILTASAIAVFALTLGYGGLAKAQTMVFTLVVVFEKFLSFNSRSLERPIGFAGIFRNKWLILTTLLTFTLHFAILYHPALNQVFSAAPLEAWEWGSLLAIGAAGFLYLEACKWWTSQRAGKNARPA